MMHRWHCPSISLSHLMMHISSVCVRACTGVWGGLLQNAAMRVTRAIRFRGLVRSGKIKLGKGSTAQQALVLTSKTGGKAKAVGTPGGSGSGGGGAANEDNDNDDAKGKAKGKGKGGSEAANGSGNSNGGAEETKTKAKPKLRRRASMKTKGAKGRKMLRESMYQVRDERGGWYRAATLSLLLYSCLILSLLLPFSISPFPSVQHCRAMCSLRAGYSSSRVARGSGGSSDIFQPVGTTSSTSRYVERVDRSDHALFVYLAG